MGGEATQSMSPGLIASSRYHVVVGLGSTGLSVARHLRALGESFVVVDTRAEPPLLEALRAEMPEVRVYAGEMPAQVLAAASELIVSPGLSPEEPWLQTAVSEGASLLGDVDLFMRAAAAPVVGITGSNAKSTVTALVGEMALAAGLDAGIGGNLGTPALELLDPARQLYVLELSSFQLERSLSLGLAVAAVLNISPDHLDRHGSMPRYHQAKHRIFHGARCAVVHSDDPLTIPPQAQGRTQLGWRLREPELHGFGLRRDEQGRQWLAQGFELLLPVDAMAMHGQHNVANALAALAIGHAAGLPMAPMLDVLRSFEGLPHRCAEVAVIDGVRYINDSKATNVGAAEAAIRGLGAGRNLLLIAGGRGKGGDYRALAAPVRAHCRHVLLIGEAAAELAATLADCARCEPCASLEQAVQRAAALAQPGDVVLLSPACASFDMFSGYAQRGDAFAAAVRALPGASS